MDEVSRQVRRAEERKAVKRETAIDRQENLNPKQKARQGKLNKVRRKLLDQIDIALRAHAQRELVGDMRHYHQVVDFNQEFVDRSRGHGTDRGFIKSVARQRDRTTYFPPEKRNGAKECLRRSRQH